MNIIDNTRRQAQLDRAIIGADDVPPNGALYSLVEVEALLAEIDRLQEVARWNEWNAAADRIDDLTQQLADSAERERKLRQVLADIERVDELNAGRGDLKQQLADSEGLRLHQERRVNALAETVERQLARIKEFERESDDPFTKMDIPGLVAETELTAVQRGDSWVITFEGPWDDRGKVEGISSRINDWCESESLRRPLLVFGGRVTVVKEQS
jgi:hypothetical protein